LVSAVGDDPCQDPAIIATMMLTSVTAASNTMLQFSSRILMKNKTAGPALGSGDQSLALQI
jgi:hypothetical protein